MPSDNATIRFLATYTVKDEEAKRYEEGESYTMTKDSAEHFIRRNLAEEVKTLPPEKAEPLASKAPITRPAEGELTTPTSSTPKKKPTTKSAGKTASKKDSE